jgi:hypothetical protein
MKFVPDLTHWCKVNGVSGGFNTGSGFVVVTWG